MRKLLFISILLGPFIIKAQMPETVVYLFDIQRGNKGITFLPPKIISKTSGYNNQPYFSPDGNYLFYVSSVDTANTEIYRYDLNKKRTKRLTKTREPEYSPRYTPNMEGLSFVCVEKDKTTQHLYTSNMKGKKTKVVLPNLKSIGYYEWINDIEFLSFELPEPFYLVKHNMAMNRTDTLATNIGRTFYNLRAKSKIVYVDKSEKDHFKLRTIAPEKLKLKKPTKPIEDPVLCETLPGEEDYCFMQDGSILMGHEGILYYKKNPFKHPESVWDELADMRNFGIDKFYRVAISADNTKLALVAFKGKKP